MTDSDIIRLMTQSGCGGTLTPAVRRFALAVRAMERERCAAVADSMRIEGAMPDSEESAQDWAATFIASEIRSTTPAA